MLDCFLISVPHFLLLFRPSLLSPCPDLEMLRASANDGGYRGIKRPYGPIKTACSDSAIQTNN